MFHYISESMRFTVWLRLQLHASKGNQTEEFEKSFPALYVRVCRPAHSRGAMASAGLRQHHVDKFHTQFYFHTATIVVLFLYKYSEAIIRKASRWFIIIKVLCSASNIHALYSPVEIHPGHQ